MRVVVVGPDGALVVTHPADRRTDRDLVEAMARVSPASCAFASDEQLAIGAIARQVARLTTLADHLYTGDHPASPVTNEAFREALWDLVQRTEKKAP